jgi:hypothetical protein
MPMSASIVYNKQAGDLREQAPAFFMRTPSRYAATTNSDAA